MSTMKGLLVICFCAVVGTTHANHANFYPSDLKMDKDKIITKVFKTKPYDYIKIDGAAKINLVKGTAGVIKVAASEKVMEKIKIKSNGVRLKIDTSSEITTKVSFLGFSYTKTVKNGNHKVVITVPFEQLRKIKISGANAVFVQDALTAQSLSVDMSGASELHVERLEVQNLRCDASDAAQITLKGLANEVSYDFSGAVKLNADALKANNAQIEMLGACSANVNVTDVMGYELSGASDLTYQGNPQISGETSGACSVHKR